MAWKVLIADDQPEIRELVRAAVEKLGCEVTEASDGQEAWHLLLELRPDMAILDVSMPERNGMELARAMAAEPALQATRVVLLTGLDPVDLPRPEDGAPPRIDLYVQKPFTIGSLRQLVEKELAR